MKHIPFMLTCMIFSLALFALATATPTANAQMMSKGISSQITSRNARSPISQQLDTMATDWKKGYKSRVRMISGDTNFTARNSAYAGVQVQMAKGWKTYWRSPGDTGVPPSFDWSGSHNVKKISILWPAPQKYKDEYSTSIGYKHEVILPIKITAKDIKKPVDMKLRFGYGICADICVPVEAHLKLTIPPRQLGYRSLLSHYRSMVPKQVEKTGKIVNGFSIKKIKVNLKGKKPSIIVDASVPMDTRKAELYVEASNGSYLPLAVSERPSAGNHRRFHIDLTKGDPPMALIGQTLALTLVGDKFGIEYKYKIN
jgi:DsbC/DsbD-like thiol-disulfide interchange protein